jgi:hypothetical protein
LQNLRREPASNQTTAHLVIEPSASRHSPQRHLGSVAHAPDTSATSHLIRKAVSRNHCHPPLISIIAKTSKLGINYTLL